MPYSLDNRDNLPENVKKMADKKQRQWIHVWNSAYDKYGDESKAFKMANGVAGKEKGISLDDLDPGVDIFWFMDMMSKAADIEMESKLSEEFGHTIQFKD
jgi:hypothetical protein